MRRRFALATIFVCLVTPLLHAQTCPAPAIGVPAEVCASFDANASVAPPGPGQSWSSIQWDITGGVFHIDVYPYTSTTATTDTVRFAADGSGSVTLTVHVVDVLGCPSQSSATVPLRSITAPGIAAPLEICPYGYGDVSVAPPSGGGAWQSINWDVTNGYFQSDQYPYQSSWASGVANVRVFSNGQGPTTVHVRVADDQYCLAEATATIGIRTIAAPVIAAPLEICPYGYGDVSVAPPPGGGAWQYVNWDVTNGYFQSDQYPYQSPYANGPNARVYSNGQGPTTVHVRVNDDQYCMNEATATIGVKSIAPPVITAPAELCPYSYGDVSVAPPPGGGAWQYVNWDVTNGYFQSDQYPYQSPYANGPNVRVYSNGQGPTTVHVRVNDDQYCMNEATATIGVKSIAAPVINTYPDALCPGDSGSAYVNPPDPNNPYATWSAVHWSITNGTIVHDWGTSVDFTADGTDPVMLMVTVTDNQSCGSTASVSIPVRTSTTIAVHTFSPSVCANGSGTVQIDDAAPDNPWTSVRWTVENGTVGYQYGTWASFNANGSGLPVVVHVSAANSTSCATGSVVIPTYTLPTPVIELSSGSCSSNSATVTNASAYSYLSWNSNDVTFTSPSNGATVTWLPTHSGHITISVSGNDENGCIVTSSVGYDAIGLPDPTISFSYSRWCAGSPITVSVPDGGPGVTYQWSSASYGIQFVGSTTDRTATFVAQNFSGGGQIAVTETTADGCGITGQASTWIPGPTTNDFASVPTSICLNGTATISTYPVVRDTYNWVVTDGDIVSGQGTSSLVFSAHAGVASVTVQATITEDDCPKTIQRVIPVFGTPTISADGPTTFCSDQVLTLTSSPGATYRWSNGATTQSIHVANFSGDYSVTVTDANGCSMTSAPVHVTVNPIPSPTINNLPAEACSGATYHASIVETFASYAWSATGVTIVGPANGQSLDFVVGAGPSATITLTLTGSNGCSKTYNFNMSIDPAPNPELIADTNACLGGNYSARVSQPGAGSKFYWSPITNATNVSITDADGTPDAYGSIINYTPVAAGPVTISVMEVNPVTNCGTTVTRTVNVMQRTPMDFAVAAVCLGGTGTASSIDNFSDYYWIIDNGTILSGQNAHDVTFRASNDPNHPTTLTLTSYSNFCTTAVTKTVPVQVPAATITASGPTTFCAGGSVTLTASSAASYLWSNGATTQSIVVNAAGNYSVAVTNANGCSATSAATTVTVNALPAPTISASGPTTFCAGGSVTLTASAASSYLWSTGATTQAITVNASGSYSVTATDANGCSATSAATTVTVDPLPVATVNVPSSICINTTAHAAVSETTFASYHWQVTNNAQILGSTNNPNVSFRTSNSSPFTISVTVTGSNGCSSTYSFTVGVNPLPSPQISGASSICVTDTGSLNVTNPTAGSSWTWSLSNATILGVFDAQGNPNPNGSRITYQPTAAGQINITLTETNANGCRGTTSGIVVANAPAPADFTVAAVCPGATGTASSNSPYAVYSWSITNGTILSGANAHDVTFRASTDVNNPTTLTLTTTSYCVTPQTKTVPWSTIPPPYITLASQTVCPATNSYATVVNSYTSYAWTITNGTIVSGANTPTVTYTAGASGNVSLTLVVNSGGCSSSSTVNVPIEDTTPPAITAPDTICYLGTFTASVPAGYDHYAWWYDNVTEVSVAPNSNSVMLRSDGTGRPIDLRVTMWRDSGAGCQVVATKTVTYAATPTPAIGLNLPANFCTGMTGQANVTNGPFATYAWTITGGTISGAANGQSISFIPDGGGNTQVAVAVTDGRGDCSATNSQYVNQANFKPVIGASNGLNFCAGSTTTLTASSGADSYLWSTGATTPAITAGTAGDYTVTTTKNGCSFSSTVTVTTYAVSASVAADKTTYCANESAATLTVTASGFTGLNRFIHWYATDSQFSLGAGTTLTASNYTRTYYAVVSDEKGCTAQSNNITITVNPLPTATINASGPTTFCAGGSVTLTASTGASYLWSTGATTQSIAVNASGNYTVAVTNAAGCSATSAARSVTVNSLAAPTITFDKPDFCPESNVTASVPAGFVSYAWSVSAGSVSGQGTNSILIQLPGTNPLTVSVTVTDLNGCSATSSATLPVRNFPKPIVSVDVTQVCAGGTAHASVTNGPYSAYFWTVVNGTVVSGAGTSQIAFTPNGGGLMTVHVTAGGADNCFSNSDDVSVAVNTPVTPTITADGPTTFCPGGSVTLTASTASSYVWSNGATTQAITVSASGNYSVTVTDANGCSSASAATAITVNPLPTPTVSASGPTTFCAGGSVTLTASSASSYLWSNGATTQAINVNASGNYSVTVTDVHGCSATSAATTVTVNPLPVATITANGPTTFCAGGSVTLTASSGASYLWSNGATTQSIVVSAAGSYHVAVTDANGCSAASADTVVTVNANPVPAITAPSAICNGASGNASTTAVSGATYSWTIGNGTITGGAGTNAITFTSTSGPVSLGVAVTDANGCSGSASASVTVNALPATTITPSGSTTFCAGGSVTLTAPAGMSAYSWSNGATSQSIVVSAAGSYHVTVTDANGCSAASTDTVVAINNGPTPAITAPSAICNGASGNASTAAVSGATYSWTIGNGTITGGAGTNSITFTSTSGPVSLGVTVTDANGCSGSASANVTVNALPSATITAPAAICSGASGAASVAAVSGGSYAWTITGGTITGGSGTNAITFTSTTGPVSLGVTVTNANGCLATGNRNVTVNALPSATITAPTAICNGTSGAASVAVSGGSYSWTITGGTITGGSGTNAITFTSTTGPVSLGVTVTNANGCSATGSASVAVNANPATPTISANGPTTFCDGGSVTLTAPASAGYHWSTGATTQSIVVTTSGSYTVSVTNASGCTSALSAPTTVTVNPATAITTQPASATIPHNTTITLNVVATGTGTLTYQWYNPPTANNNDTSKKVGTNLATFTTPKLSNGPHYYYVVVTGSCGTVRSAIATITGN